MTYEEWIDMLEHIDISMATADDVFKLQEKLVDYEVEE